MRPSVVVEGARVFLGDCRDVLKSLPDNSVDSIVTDPPYELGFMGKSWDNSGIAYDVTVWEECLRVLKPGGHILAFGGTRTWHRLAVAIEDAGFEIRDNIAWLYGSGFPKSLDVSKAVDKKLGAEREVIGQHQAPAKSIYSQGEHELSTEVSLTSPATPEAQQWQGWGTALKPAFEPVVVGRKPLVGTVAENVLAWGVGGLNIDGSRIASQPGENFARPVNHTGLHEGWDRPWKHDPDYLAKERLKRDEIELKASTLGRWPANVVLDEFTAGLLDEQSGVLKSGAHNGKSVFNGAETPASFVTGMAGKVRNRVSTANEGGASRFFYQAKASKRDRNEGLEDLGDTHPSEVTGRKVGSAGAQNGGYAGMTETPRKNFHPTVKPTQLMRYLIKLVTPEGGTVLDPFTGSGSTGKAALLDGYEFIGAELTEEYLPIIEGRLRWAVKNRDEETLF